MFGLGRPFMGFTFGGGAPGQQQNQGYTYLCIAFMLLWQFLPALITRSTQGSTTILIDGAMMLGLVALFFAINQAIKIY
jgi:hypothetical protein